MAVVIRRNGRITKSDTQRLASIREQIRVDQSRSAEDLEVYLIQLRERVRKYERRYEITSKFMLESLRSGELNETRDISLWALTWQTLKRAEGETPTTGIR